MNINDLEKNRKIILFEKLLVYVITFIIIILFDTYIVKDYFDDIRIIIIIFYGFICVLINSFVAKKQINKYKEEIKKIVFIYYLKNLFNDFSYVPNSGITYSLISFTNMIPRGNVYYSSDLIGGKYKNVKFVGSFVSVEKESITQDPSTTHHLKFFKGWWFIFEFNKSFKSEIQICNKYFANTKRGGLLDDFINDRINYKKEKRVKTNDNDFDNKFKIYVKNDVNVFQFIDAELIDKIKKLNTNVGGNLLLCFINNQLHIGLDGKSGFFEPSIIKKINLEDSKNKVFEEIKPIIEFIEVIDLKSNLFVD